jgi:hypothetical protein
VGLHSFHRRRAVAYLGHNLDAPGGFQELPDACAHHRVIVG